MVRRVREGEQEKNKPLRERGRKDICLPLKSRLCLCDQAGHWHWLEVSLSMLEECSHFESRIKRKLPIENIMRRNISMSRSFRSLFTPQKLPRRIRPPADRKFTIVVFFYLWIDQRRKENDEAKFGRRTLPINKGTNVGKDTVPNMSHSLHFISKAFSRDMCWN